MTQEQINEIVAYLKEKGFSIHRAPDPQYVFMAKRDGETMLPTLENLLDVYKFMKLQKEVKLN